MHTYYQIIRRGTRFEDKCISLSNSFVSSHVGTHLVNNDLGKQLPHNVYRLCFGSLRTADAFPVVASLPPKNNVCEPERQSDFRDVKPF